MKNTIISTCIFVIIAILKLFKRSVRRQFAKFIANLILNHSTKIKQRAMANITQAFPYLTASQVEELTYTSYQNIAFGVLECFWLDELHIDIECEAETLKLLYHKNGAAIATMHMSCYEIAPVGIERLVGQVTTMSKIPPYLKSAKQLYKKSNIDVINSQDNNAFLQLINKTRNKGMVCLHADHFSNNIPVNFFGRKTKAPAGIAMVAAYQKAPLLIAYGLLQDNGRYKLILETVNSGQIGNNTQSISKAVAEIYHRFENIIKADPQQWCWSYNRWRN